ncbi:MAG: sialate O-acetylesterase [Kiritimatiellia bacterium]
MKRLFLPACLVAASMAFAKDADEASFASPFTSRAVLQRDCPLPVFGFATPGSTVTVALDRRELATTVGADGKWKVVFPAMKAGLGHVLKLSSGGRTFAELDDIAIGDVWICSGQSNMAMNYHGGITRGREEMERNEYFDIRLFNEMEAFSFKPLDRVPRPVEWRHADFDSARTFSACAYFFAAALRERLPNVPIGLVNVSWSGSAISAWMSLEAYASADDYCKAAAKSHLDRLAAYEAGGGAEGFAARLEQWKKDCDAKGAIPAEKPAFNDADWEAVELPSLLPPDFDGCAWFRRKVKLTGAQAAADAVLSLGALDDRDIVHVNGVQVGADDRWNVPRLYPVPAGTLRAGDNVIAVRLWDVGGEGGFLERDLAAFALKTPAGDVPLGGAWKTKRFAFDPQPFDPSRIQYWTPAVCYNAMVHPLFPMAAKGAIWYQGCSDVGDSPRYANQVRALVKDWRSRFTHPDGFPFYIVQLAAFQRTNEHPVDSAWASMRWTQMLLGETMEKSGTAVLLDAGDHDDIHPKDKKTPGERLARLALARTYGMKDVVEAGPIPVAIKRVKDERVGIAFKNAAGLKTSDGGNVKGFQLAGEDGRFVWAEAEIMNQTVALKTPDGMKPAKVRYAWDDYPDCNLVNGENLPCGPFELAVR